MNVYASIYTDIGVGSLRLEQSNIRERKSVNKVSQNVFTVQLPHGTFIVGSTTIHLQYMYIK